MMLQRSRGSEAGGSHSAVHEERPGVRGGWGVGLSQRASRSMDMCEGEREGVEGRSSRASTEGAWGWR